MRTSIATVSISGALTEKLHASAAAGFDGVEIFEPDLIASDHSPEEIRSLARRLGLSLDLYQPLRDIEGVDEDDLRREPAPRRRDVRHRAAPRHRHDSRLQQRRHRNGRLRRGIGRRSFADWATLRSSTTSGWPSRRWRGAGSSTTTAGRGASSSSPTIRRSGSASTASTCCPAATTPPPSRASPATRSSTSSLPTPPPSAWTCCPGAGTIGCSPAKAPSTSSPSSRTCCQRVSTARCRWRSSTTRSGRPIRAAPRCMRSVHWCGCRTRSPRSVQSPGGPGCRRWRRRSLPTVSTSSSSRPRTPARSRCCSTSWASRRVDVTAPSRCRCGPRASARVILNEQQARDQAPHIAAIGFGVPDAEAMSRRAADLKAAPAYRRTYAAEQELDGAVAPDGTEIYWVTAPANGLPPAWIGEFENGLPARQSPVNVIDHVNLLQPWQTADEAVLFLSSIFGLSADAPTEVAGPTGLVRSQVMRTTDGSVRLPLNVAPHVLDGSAVPQHVAFACTDVVGLARAARERGLAFLPIPDNYYDYVAGRFGVDADDGGRSYANSTCCTTAAPTASSCTSTRARSGRCSSNSSSAVGITTATAPTTRRSGWPLNDPFATLTTPRARAAHRRRIPTPAGQHPQAFVAE